tara:strand:+ start:38 stop:952 length:915 start_codon:yes stop_codon:yes gene_type:complete
MTKQIVVLMGGKSGEREVSLRSGAAVVQTLRSLGYEVCSIDAAQDVLAELRAMSDEADVVFNALHGRYGEDGCIQGVCEVLGIPYTHSGVLASALAMDKVMSKKLFRHVGIPVPDGGVFSIGQIFTNEPLQRPYVVKPINQGSSLGVHIIREGDRFPFEEGHENHERMVLVEDYVPGRELTVAVMKERGLEVLEIKPTEGFYDYDSKYKAGHSEYLVPAPVSYKTRTEILNFALLAHQVLGCRGVTRADFRYDDTEGGLGLRLLEVNTQPGLTPTSLVPEIASYVGINFSSLINWMVEDARCNT